MGAKYGRDPGDLMLTFLAGGLVASLRGKAPAELASTIGVLLNEPGIRACVDALRG